MKKIVVVLITFLNKSIPIWAGAPSFVTCKCKRFGKRKLQLCSAVLGSSHKNLLFMSESVTWVEVEENKPALKLDFTSDSTTCKRFWEFDFSDKSLLSYSCVVLRWAEVITTSVHEWECNLSWEDGGEIVAICQLFHKINFNLHPIFKKSVPSVYMWIFSLQQQLKPFLGNFSLIRICVCNGDDKYQVCPQKLISQHGALKVHMYIVHIVQWTLQSKYTVNSTSNSC